MTHEIRPNAIIATDLDGTLIPLADDPQNRHDLKILSEEIAKHAVTLTFVTGRHLKSVQKARTEFHLPRPDWIICDVGTTIYHLDKDGQPQEVTAYAEHLAQLIAALPIPELRERLRDLSGLRLQEEEKQGACKLSYYADADSLDSLVADIQNRLDQLEAPYSLIASVDPFNGDGLVDFLPKQVSKAYALTWWSEYAGFDRHSVVFAGDSGNDTAALTAGFRAIVVGNADRKVARNVYDNLKDASGFANQSYLAQLPATSGVLEGCRWFHVFPENDATPTSKGTTDLPLGATPLGLRRTHFRVWAAKRKSVAVEIRRGSETQTHSLTADEEGYYSGTVGGAGPLDLYRYVLDDDILRPDPVSRFQPNGVHGESMIVDPDGFPWSDQNWQGVAKRDLVIYELHVGTFTEEGTFLSAIGHLPRLKELGITAVEVLPVAQTPGKWNWGYDGVNLFAPRNTFGSPDDFKVFIDACHNHGLAVLLDVVYNHVGPEGNYWGDFAPYYSDKHHTPWGDAFAFDGPEAKHVRRFVIENASFWLREYHLDGLRLDAVHCMYDDNQPHILQELRESVAQLESQVSRPLHLIAEANIYDSELLPPKPTLSAYDAIWVDDIMHAIYSVITPETNVTHRAYNGPADLAEALLYGFLYQGMPQERLTKELRTKHSDNNNLFRQNFVIALQNHDNVGNHPHGKRMHQLTSPAHQKAAAALVLLYPAIPLIFMGEEHATTSPFRFFVDFEDEHLRKAVDEGRAREYPHQVWAGAISPSDERAFHESQLSGSDDPTMFAWYQSLLGLRKHWQHAGILHPENLTTIWEPAAHLFGLRYHTTDGEFFVLSRLFAIDDSPSPIQIQVEGEVLLDSLNQQLSDDSKAIEISGVRALIGCGSFSLQTRE